MDRQNVGLPQRAATTGIIYNTANQMLPFNTQNMTYDANGNMISLTNACGTTNYTWDARNRLVGINGFTSTCTSLSASFEYDALGRRIQKSVTDTVNGTRTTNYIYDGLDIVQEIENGIPAVNYIRTLNIDEPLARIKADGSVRYYQTDALGSVIALTDEMGVARTKYSYDPFGNVTISGEASDNPFQYTGRENDGTGLYFYRARYYSPELQRFISEDPIGFAGGTLNLYEYVGNNPVNFVDPLGLIHYNAPPPRTVPVQGETLEDLECVEQCLQDATNNPNLDLLITGGAERRGHSRRSHHYRGKACDIHGSNPVKNGDVMSCAAQCGFGAGRWESFRNNPNRNHWHLQLTPGNGVPALPAPTQH